MDLANNVLKEYWNGWWISNKCAYAIGHISMYSNYTDGIKLQLYETRISRRIG